MDTKETISVLNDLIETCFRNNEFAVCKSLGFTVYCY